MGKHVTKKNSTIRLKLKNSVALISEYDENKKISLSDYIKLSAAAAILIIDNLFKASGIVELLAYLIPFFLISYDVFFSAIRKIEKRTFPYDEALVIVCSVLCFAVGSYTEAVAVVIAYKISLVLSDLIEKRLKKTEALISVGNPTECRIQTPEGGIRFDSSDLRRDDVVTVDNDEAVPRDGRIESGGGAFDYGALTGENSTVMRKAGDYLAEGCINRSATSAVIRIMAEEDSTGQTLRKHLLSSSDVSSEIEKHVFRALKYFSISAVPLAVIVALIPGIITDMWFDWISRAVIILFVSQTSVVRKLIRFLFRSGIILLTRKGIFVLNNKVLERINRSETFVFEKSGVITEGEYDVKKVYPLEISEGELLNIAAKAEAGSDHPLARALLRTVDGKELKKYTSDRFTEFPGKGVSAYINGKKVYAGRYSFVSGFCESHAYADSAGTNIHLCIDGKYSGFISFSDRIKEGAFDALENLRSGRSAKLVMLTGDSAVSSRKMAASLNFDMLKAEITSEDKKNSLEYLEKNKNKGTWVTFVGNNRTDKEIYNSAEVAVSFVSLNDYPLINDSADVLIFGKDIERIADTVHMSDSVIRRVTLSTVIIAAFKALQIVFCFAGLLPVLASVIIDTFANILVSVYMLYLKK